MYWSTLLKVSIASNALKLGGVVRKGNNPRSQEGLKIRYEYELPPSPPFWLDLDIYVYKAKMEMFKCELLDCSNNFFLWAVHTKGLVPGQVATSVIV